MATIEAFHLRKTFGEKKAIDEVSFSAEAGEIVGLVGPNGAGKTTLMLMLTGLLRADQGEIRLLGQQLRPSDPAQKNHIGWVPQQLAFYPGLSVWENLCFFGSLYPMEPSLVVQRASEVLQACRLEDVRNQAGSTLSGGTQRRLNLALGLVHEPSLLILDEPTVGIDAESRNLILRYLTQLASRGKTVILSSHYEEEIQRTCHRMVKLELGRVVSSETLHPDHSGVPNLDLWNPPDLPPPKPHRWKSGLAIGLIVLALIVAASYFQRSAKPLSDPEAAGRSSPASTAGISKNSPDQMRLAYLSQGSIWIRDVDLEEPYLLNGTEGADPGFFWSPNSRTLVFSRQGSLWQTNLEGLETREICQLPERPFRAGNWGPDGQILFSVGVGNVYRVGAEGGAKPELLLRK